MAIGDQLGIIRIEIVHSKIVESRSFVAVIPEFEDRLNAFLEQAEKEGLI